MSIQKMTYTPEVILQTVQEHPTMHTRPPGMLNS